MTHLSAIRRFPAGSEHAEPVGNLPDPTYVLIVDDNLQNLELMQAYLEELDCPVRTARDGLEAIELVDQAHPDVILLDVMMPRMSGFQVCTKLKAAQNTRDIPIIMVTALNELSDVEKAMESGADDFVTKPVNKQELVLRVKSLLQLRLLRRKMKELSGSRGRGTGSGGGGAE
ncbi:MAG: response regulator [Phycisphaerales bacterium]|nr:response regulator [Phycisphaerales bacterium]